MKASSTILPRYWVSWMAGLPTRWMVRAGEGRAADGTAGWAAAVRAARPNIERSAVRMGIDISYTNRSYTARSATFMEPFDPLFRNPHLQTIAGHYWRRPSDFARFPIQRRLYRTERSEEHTSE